LYVAESLDELKQLQTDIQDFSKQQLSLQNIQKTPEGNEKKLSIKSLSGSNQKIVRKLLRCKSPSDMSLGFSEIRNLLLDIGFVESNVKGTHHKFVPPVEIFFNGIKQPFITVAYQRIKTNNPAQIDDLINVCKQYYGNEE
jgi:hypothetical protein